MTTWQILLTREFFSNTVQSILIAAAVFLCIVVVLRGVLAFVIQKLSLLAERTRTKIDDAFVKTFNDIHSVTYAVIGLYVSAEFLVLPSFASKVITALAVITVVVEVVRIVQSALLFLVRKFWLKDGSDAKQLEILMTILLRLVLWSVGILMVLSNLGINVTSLVASLGIGGIAIALAAQSILGDLFSAFTIYTDKPFKIGDFIVVGDNTGTVKQVGLKTTRIEALQGEEIVISNNELTSTSIRNFKRMNKRRVDFSIGVEYGTPLEKLKKIPEMVKQVITALPHAEFDRAHFKEFADSSLNYEVIFYVKSSEYIVYMDTRQEINFGIVEAFEKEKIGMAFPTRTVHLVQAK